MIDAPSPAAISVRVEQHAVIVWGDAKALIELKNNVDAEGGMTQWRTTGPAKTFLLFIAATGPKASPDMQRLINDINDKKHGDLTAGWGNVGDTR